MTDDAIVIGAGPNGLVAACMLARAGLSVRVLEAEREYGGACRTRASTRPGFVHDFGAGFFPFGRESPAFRALDLESAGVEWLHAEIDSAHPARDGSVAGFARDVDRAAEAMGGGEDGDAWRRLATWWSGAHEQLLPMLLGPLPPIPTPALLAPRSAWNLARAALMTGRGFAASHFESEAARRVIPALALHTDVGPDDSMGAVVGFMLAMTGSLGGFGVPRGGSGAITDALVKRLEASGGTLETSAPVRSILTEGGRAIGVKLEDGREISASRAVVADTSAPKLFLEMLDRAIVPSPVVDAMKSYPMGFGTFKVDWALDGPVPWTSELARKSAVVHTGEDTDDLGRFVAEVRRGELPHDPYLVIGQQSIIDSSRAPKGKHTLYAYSRVPSKLAHGTWNEDTTRGFLARIERRIEELAPGFGKSIIDRAVFAPPDLEKLDRNLVGGDLGGGSADIKNQLFFRPMFPYFRYRTPVRALYLASSYAHPGAGVHGMCGFNAAKRVLGDL